MRNEKITQYNKRNHTHRIVSFALSICMACLCIIHPTIAFASVGDTDVEIVSTNDHGYYEVYDSNGNIVNSFVQGTSSGFFVKSWNALAKNIARITSTVYNTNQVNSSINNLLNSTNSLLNTISTNSGYINNHISLIQDQMSSYFGANASSYPNNIYGKLDYIQTYTYQNVQRLDQIKTILNNGITLSKNPNIDWNTLETNFEFSTDNITYYSLNDFGPSTSARTLYIKIYSSLDSSQYLSYLRIPFYTLGDIDLSYYVLTNLYSVLDSNYSVYKAFRNTDLYILPFNVYGNQNYPTILKLDFSTAFYKATNGTPELFYKYLTPNQTDYYAVQDLIYNYTNTQQNKEIVSAIESNAFDDQDIIDAINSLSLVDNDVKIEVNYTHNDALDVTGAIQYITSFFKGNGVTLADFTSQSNTSQSQWLSQTNQDLLGTATGGYVDLYE